MEQHRQLIKWAYECVERVLPLWNGNKDIRVANAIEVAKEWEKGKVMTGAAMKASLAAHAAAREASNLTNTAIARAAGQAVATAHMSDHSMGGALYALKAVKSMGGNVEKERKWQIEQLPKEVKELIVEIMEAKGRHFKI